MANLLEAFAKARKEVEYQCPATGLQFSAHKVTGLDIKAAHAHSSAIGVEFRSNTSEQSDDVEVAKDHAYSAMLMARCVCHNGEPIGMAVVEQMDADTMLFHAGKMRGQNPVEESAESWDDSMISEVSEDKKKETSTG